MDKGRRAILIDIDHVLSDARWRDSMMAFNDWDSYHYASKDDRPIEELVYLVDVFHGNGNPIIGITTRPEKWRKLTNDWLIRQLVNLDEVLMRPNDNYEKSPQLKVTLVQTRFKNPKEEVLMILDNRQDVIEAFKALGIVALQVHA